MSERHIHDWQPRHPRTCPVAGVYTCTQCTETSACCNACGRPTGGALHACPQCVDQHATILDDIADALGHWRHQPRSPVPAIRYDRDLISGNRTDNNPTRITHPAEIVTILWQWRTMWEETITPSSTGDVVVALKGMLIWAISNPIDSAWPDFASEIRQLRHTARRLAGLLPKRQYGPCVYCGGQIVRDWADDHWQPRTDGLSDELRCTGCGMTWDDHDRWMYVNGHTLRLVPKFAPDTLVTLEDARKHIFPDVPAATWRSWLLRDQRRAEDGYERLMPERGTDVRGNDLYRVADLATLVDRRKDDTREGRPAQRAL